jgi:hypothetical protein
VDGLREVAELAGGGPVEFGDVEHAGQSHEVGRAEQVARDAQLHGDLERPWAEEVRDERGHAGRRLDQGAEEVPEPWERALDDGEDAGLHAGVRGEVTQRHLGEHGGGDGRWEGRQRGVEVGRREVGVRDERGRELSTVAVRGDDATRELGHRQDVAGAGAREKHDVSGSFLGRRRGLLPHGSARQV